VVFLGWDHRWCLGYLSHQHLGQHSTTFLFFLLLLLKGPVADATDAQQPEGLLCNPVMKMIRFFYFSILMEHWWNGIDGKTKVLGENPVPVAILSTTNPT
jgi:hypothetical protein